MTDCNTRVCTRCGSEHPLTAEYFQRSKGYKLGFNSQCRKCRNEQARHYPSTKSERKKQTKAAHAKRPDVVERKNQRRRERYANDLEYRQRLLDDNNKRRIANPELTKVKKREEYQRHKNKYKESGRKYYLKNRDVYIERAKKYKPDPIKRAIGVQRRLARKRELPDTLTKEQWLACLEYFNNQCAVCGKPFDEQCKPYMDHWIPLKSPDCLGTVVKNIVCLCGGKGGCNESKHSHDAKKWLSDFYPSEQAQAILQRIEEYFASLI